MRRTVEVPEYEVHSRVPIDPTRTALLVIDMQNDFVKEGGALVVPDAEATLPQIARLRDLARQAAMKIVFSQDTHDEGDPHFDLESSLRQTAFLFAGRVTTTDAIEVGEPSGDGAARRGRSRLG